jgi:LacI family transcriptional regulator
MKINLIFKPSTGSTITMQQSTLKQLSESLGLSISTVSRALKDHPDISDATKKKVKELAAVMDYEPNSYAIQLRTRKSNVLGVLLPTINNFFYDSFIAAVEEQARKNGYTVMIIQSADMVEEEIAALKHFRKNMVSGLFAALSIETDDLTPFQKLHDSGVPVVFFDRVPVQSGFTKTCLSDEKAAQLAAAAIIEKQKKHVLALFGHPHLSISQLREASFLKTFKERSPQTKIQVEWPEQMEASYQAVIQAFRNKEKPDVIFCMGDMILIGVMRAIHELGLNVPGDVGVIGISNGLFPTMYNPTITYVETSGAKLGRLAFEQMMNSLHNKPLQPEVFVESVLVKGGSL